MRAQTVLFFGFLVLAAACGSDAGSRSPAGSGGNDTFHDAGAAGGPATGSAAGASGAGDAGRTESESSGGLATLGRGGALNDGVAGAAFSVGGDATASGEAGNAAAAAGGQGESAGGANAAGGSAASSGGASGLAGTGGGAHVGVWRVMPLGDSITGTTCYPKLLSQELSVKGHASFQFVGTVLNNQSCGAAPNVQTEGHGGFLISAASTLSAMPGWFSADRPDVVLMHFGTNDVWNNVAASSILSAYSTAVNDVRAVNGNAIFLVAQIIAMHPAGCDACESRVETLNSQIPAWATSKSTARSPIYVVDVHSAFDSASYTPNSTFTQDGVHPNPAGSQKIADIWFAALHEHGLF